MNSLNDMWSAVCECAKEKYNVNSEAFKLWFTPITLKSFDGQKAVLSINNNSQCLRYRMGKSKS